MRKELIRYRLERWRKIFQERIVWSFESDKRYFEKLLREMPNEDDYGELRSLEDDEVELHNLFCVALWSVVEHYLNRLGTILARWEGSYKWKAIESFYNNREVNLRGLPGFKKTNIVRLINNCVKHNNGQVTEELHGIARQRFKKEIEGKRQRIELTQEEVLSYFHSAEEFLCSLVDACYLRAGGKSD